MRGTVEAVVLRRSTVIVAVAAIALAACGSDDDAGTSGPTDSAAPTADDDPSAGTSSGSTTDVGVDDDGQDVAELFPDVIDATAEFDGAAWTISATLSSPYDSPDRYADAWRVVGPDGSVYGERILTHDHANEQPFTRSQSGIEIPDEVTEVTIEGRDQISGWGGDTVTITLQR